MNNSIAFQPNWASPPGDTIKDILHEQNIEVSEFARTIEKSVRDATKLLKGNLPIDEELALDLEKIVGGSMEFWINREKQYRNDLLHIANSENEQETWLSKFPTRDMASFGWIPKTRSKREKLKNLLDFFKVSSTQEWENKYKGLILDTAFRTTETFEPVVEATISWLRQGSIVSENSNCAPLCKRKLLSATGKIKTLSREKNPATFLPPLKKILASCGVVLVIAPTPSGCRASGATFSTPNGKAVVMLSFRYLSDDHFWFTLFHEIGHLILHSDRQLFIEEKHISEAVAETEANQFARNILIPEEYESEFSKLNSRRWREIIRFAKKLQISPGIVVGQLQHAGLLRHDYLNKLKNRYNWKSIPQH
ncbi:ImmA/IrrE family metallo-endopeptidase [Microbulbifer sp. CAU 1566]|uniref:ImmA/IrrE family metallo-endopeptidase n=1 Tax=Microbulbifer sp. CAU 1566 TaxID=2933269 RepID=UPI002004A031|nr:ImmA/IrrE family metallo-endopeptidase [Microbulbifer sp. CAU 1566]MCK7597078.1 ImmA/IrrE family metallo-endopeptidase [Microbulbifer sp. CAU 1566]